MITDQLAAIRAQAPDINVNHDYMDAEAFKLDIQRKSCLALLDAVHKLTRQPVGQTAGEGLIRFEELVVLYNALRKEITCL